MTSQSTSSFRFRQESAKLWDANSGPGATKQWRVSQKKPLEMLLDLAADEEYFDLRQAAEFARTSCLDHADFEETMLAAIESDNSTPEQAIRLIRVLEVICHKTKLLSHLLELKAAEPRVNSKIKLTVGRLVQNAAWLREQLSDPEPRVRANAVEALWGVRIEGVEDLLWTAAEDPNNRVVANAACGLYKLGFVESTEILQFLLRHSDPMFRRSGIWAATQVCDPRFVSALRHLEQISEVDQEEITLREAALKLLESRLEIAQFSDRIQLKINSGTLSSRGRRIVQFCCTPSFPNVSFTPEAINATHFQVEENGCLIDNFEFQWLKPSEARRGVVLAPEGVALGLGDPRKMHTLEQESGWSVIRFQAASDMELPEHTDQRMVSGRLGGLRVIRSLPNLVQALAGSVESAKELDVRAQIFLLVNRSQQGLPGSVLLKTIRSSGIVVNSIVAEDAEEKVRKCFAKLSADTGGSFLLTASAQLLASQIHQVRCQQSSGLSLSWHSDKQKPQTVVIRFVGPQGYGEATLNGGEHFRVGSKAISAAARRESD